MLFRDPKKPDTFVHIRIWLSKDARETAVNDPDVHRYWKELSEYGVISTTFEELETIFTTQNGLAEESPDPGI